MHVHSDGLGLDAPTVTGGLMNDHITGYLLAIAAVAALAEREEKGGFWHVYASLTRTSMLGNELVGSVDDEPYEPVTVQDLIEHGVDQDSPWGTFTRFTPPVAFSDTPSFAVLPPAWPGTYPDTTGGRRTRPSPGRRDDARPRLHVLRRDLHQNRAVTVGEL